MDKKVPKVLQVPKVWSWVGKVFSQIFAKYNAELRELKEKKDNFNASLPHHPKGTSAH